MLRGRVVETGPVKNLFTNPHHPYTKGLLLCRPALHVKGERLPVLSDFIDNKDSESPENSADHLLKTDPPIGHVPVDFRSVPEPALKSKHGPVNGQEILLSVKSLHVGYSSGKTWLGSEKHWVDAIQDINFDIYRGETLGLVGESGSGKSTLGRALLGLKTPVKGSIIYGGEDLLSMSKSALRDFRRNIQIVFQDPYSSLNPRLMIGPAISEPLRVHDALNQIERKYRAMEWLQKVNLKPQHFIRYPHAFSGGQRQRIVIARALVLNPGFVVFDESVSALDVSVQAQILNLINDLKANLGFTALFISHDLSVIRYLCDRVLIMENGRIVESGNAEDVYTNPKTAYTRSLIEAIPGGSFKPKA
jgi:peptide/nickel transport system ATP-binding protein